MALECIMFWAEWFPLDPLTGDTSKFVLVYDNLKAKGVTFPTKITYFKNVEGSQLNLNSISNSNINAAPKEIHETPKENAKGAKVSDSELEKKCG